MTPRMSLILVTKRDYAAVRKTIACLRAQSVKNQLELVLVSPTPLTVIQAEVEEFERYQNVVRPTLQGSADGLAAGILSARAPIVACCEDHAFPQPGWAEALLRAHEQPYAAVGPVMLNANPNTSVSWVNFLESFAQWMCSNLAGEMDSAAGHNTSYKRAVLLEYGDDLPRRMQSERALHYNLIAQGQRIYMAADARVAHVNLSRMRSLLVNSWLGGRVFGQARAENWPFMRRVMYAGAFPLVPLVRAARLLKLMRVCQLEIPIQRILPLLLFGLLLHASGEAVGYLWGAGRAVEDYASYELHRFEHVVDAEKRLGEVGSCSPI